MINSNAILIRTDGPYKIYEVLYRPVSSYNNLSSAAEEEISLNEKLYRVKTRVFSGKEHILECEDVTHELKYARELGSRAINATAQKVHAFFCTFATYAIPTIAFAITTLGCVKIYQAIRTHDQSDTGGNLAITILGIGLVFSLKICYGYHKKLAMKIKEGQSISQAILGATKSIPNSVRCAIENIINEQQADFPNNEAEVIHHAHNNSNSQNFTFHATDAEKNELFLNPSLVSHPPLAIAIQQNYNIEEDKEDM